MNIQKQTVTTDASGTVLSFKIETVEWNPPHMVRSGSRSKAMIAIMGLKIGEVKRIVHPDMKCKIKEYETSRGRSCSLMPTIYKMRKQGWELEYYHEADHILVIRRLK